MDPINQNPVVQTNGGSKKGLYILIGVLALIIIGFVVYAVSGSTRNVGVGGINAEVTKKLDGSTTVKSDYGTMTTGTNELPENWPSDAPTYKNATITASMALDPKYSGQEGSTVAFTTNDSLDSVISFYKSELVSKGWAMVGNSTTMGASTVLSARKDTRMLSVVITNGSKISVAVSISVMPDSLNKALNNQQSNQIPNPTSNDDQSKSVLSSMRAQAELYYDSNSNSYKGYCGSKGENGAYVLAIKLPQGSVYKCNDASTSWAAGVQIGIGAWCVDSSGFAGNTTSVPKATSCK